MNIGLGIGIPFTRSSLWASIFTPSALFLDGSTQGVWYDPGDINLTWRRNLLTYTEQFDNAVWAKSNATITANSTTAPDGTTTADTLLTSSTAINTGITRLYSVADGSTISIYAKANSSGFISISAETSVWWANFNLSTGAVGNSNGCTPSITSVGNGWYQCTVANVLSSSNYITFCPITANTTTFGWGASCAAGNSVYIWGAQLELGSTATEYQRITDGVQDYLQYQAQPVLYRDAAGTQPVTAVEQPVGLMLDKSKGLALGPELVTNGDFSNGTTGWSAVGSTLTVVSGKLNVATTGTNQGASQTITFAAGKTYRVNVDVTHSGVDYNILFGFAFGQGQMYSTGRLSTSRTVSFCVTPGASSWVLSLFSYDAGNVQYDNISVRELPGNHAFNPSGNSANFPVLSARYNLLTKTELLTDAAWTKTAGVTVTDNAAIAPDGTMTASTIAFGAFNREIAQSFSATAATTIPMFYVKGTAGQVLNFGTSGLNLSITLTGGWDIATSTLPVGITKFYIGNFAGNANALNISIWHPDLRVANDGVNLPAYQRVNTATDYDTVGFKPYLKFNGVNQWLQTNSIDFTYGDKMFVCAGVRKLSDAAEAILYELSSNLDTNNGAFNLFAPGGISVARDSAYVAVSKGTTKAFCGPAAASYPAPVTNIVTSADSISGPSIVARVNGTQVATSTATQGTGNYGNYPLYIGARAGSSLWFNGRLYGMVVAGKQASAAEIQDTEKYMNLKTAAYN